MPHAFGVGDSANGRWRRRLSDGLTELMHGDGDDQELFWERMFDEIRNMAKQRIVRESDRNELRPTEFPGIVFERLGGEAGIRRLQNSRVFFGSVARIVRRELVDRARSRDRLKRGGGWKRVASLDFDTLSMRELLACEPSEANLLMKLIDDLEKLDPLAVEVIWLRLMSGMDRAAMARYVDLSPAQLDRVWRGAVRHLRRMYDEAES